MAAAVAAGCGSGDATFDVRESVEQLHVTHAEPGDTLVLEDKSRDEVARGEVDELGSLIFRNVPPGERYRIRSEATGEEARKLQVWSVEESLPDPEFYRSQVLEPGFNYITTRDGTTLSAYVVLPGPVEDGPYPTLINYSGYSPSQPGGPLDEGFTALCDDYPVLCDVPSHPSGLIAGLNGFATVGVNMRGTGCSGGAYDFFERLQLLDGYDVVEVVAAQSWVLHNHVGMAGLSYPGITQMFVASEQPPSLAAISPLSVIGNTMTTLTPGGILNDGFALGWAQRVVGRADPYGQGWEQGMVDGGDEVCAENQLLHGQKADVIQKIFDTPFYSDEVALPVDPSAFVDRIEVPVFLASAWQDEQTGPGFEALLDKFTGSPQARLSVYNGVHPDGYAPQILVEWKQFLDFHVTRDIIPIDPVLRNLAPVLFQELLGAPLELPEERFLEYADVDEAFAAYSAEDPVRVIFESGASPDYDPGAPVGAFEVSFPSWPIAPPAGRRWFFQPDGSLADSAPSAAEAASRFTHDAAEGQRSALAPGGYIWDVLPDWDWQENGTGRAVAFVSEPLAQDLVIIGAGSVDLWLRSNQTDADLEVTLSEVRPDGQEMFVQAGWLRASHRAPGPNATVLEPEQTFREEHNAPLVPGEWTEARVRIEAAAHVFRAGSQIRITVDTPGGTRSDWRFRILEFSGDAIHDIGHDAARPSSVVLPVVPGVSVPSPLPACPSLRGQPCRAYAPYTNESAL